MVDVPQADVVAVLTRAPSAGGKSRLFASLGLAPDPELLAALLLDTIDRLPAAPVRRVVAVEPASACDDVRALVPRDVEVIAQCDGTLGDRMRGVMADLFAAGAARVALVGSDLPMLEAQTIVAALATLHRDPQSLVIGPAADGGYYLIAAAHVPDVFDGIAWGSADVLAQTLRAAATASRRVHLAGTIADVDTAADLDALVARERAPAPRTRAWMRRHTRKRSTS